MSTIALLRTTYVNNLLRRVDGETVPWADTVVNQHITDALAKLWPEIGAYLTATLATSQASDIYTIPNAITSVGGRISRIDLEQTSGGISALVDKITNWRYISGTQIRVRPLLPTDSTLALRFIAWVPFKTDATDLPVRLEPTVSERAAALAFGSEMGYMANAQTQQGLDSGRVLDYATLVGLSSYYERRYQDAISKDPARVSYGPRYGRR